MLNQVVLVGRIKELKNNILTLKVQDVTKNEKGEYSYNLIHINMSGNISSNVNDYCQLNDIVGVKGKVVSGNRIYAEKITFLSSSKK